MAFRLSGNHNYCCPSNGNGAVTGAISTVHGYTSMVRNPAAFPKVGDCVVSYWNTLTVVEVNPNADELHQVVYRNTFGTIGSTSLLQWSSVILNATEIRLAEDNQPAVPQEPECTCVSLLFGHETKCPMWRKI